MRPPKLVVGTAVFGLFVLIAIVVSRLLAGAPEQAAFLHPVSKPPAKQAPLAIPVSAPIMQSELHSDAVQNPNESDLVINPREAFALTLDKYHKTLERLSNVHRRGRSLDWDLAYGFIEARLLAICFPGEIETLATGIVSDPTSTSADRVFAIRILGVLGASGRKVSEGELVKLAEGNDRVLVPVALDAIFSYDKRGDFRHLYRNKCGSGIGTAFDLGPYWIDVPTAQLFEHLLVGDGRRTVEEQANISFLAREGIERMSILQSPDRTLILEKYIAGGNPGEPIEPNKEYRQSWALYVASLEPTPRILEILQRRLSADASRVSVTKPMTSTDQGYAHATGDEYFDRVLLIYNALGGSLTESQVRRLTYFGYLGNPKARLSQLLSADK